MFGIKILGYYFFKYYNISSGIKDCGNVIVDYVI